MTFLSKPFPAFLRNTGLASGVVQLTLFLFTISLFQPYFETNDDVSMMLMAAGRLIVEQPTEHIAITSCMVLGWVLKMLYALLPKQPWYGILYFALLNVSFIIILQSLICRATTWGGFAVLLFLYLIWYALFGVENTVIIQFTRLAGLLGFAAGLLLYINLSNHRNDLTKTGYIKPLIAIFLLVLASSIRISSVIFAILLLVTTLEFYQFNLSSLKKIILTRGAILLFTLLLMLSAEYFYQYQLRRWNVFFDEEYNLRTLVDFNSLEVSGEKEKLLKKLGWSETDYQLVMSFFFLHPAATTPAVETIFDAIGTQQLINKKQLSLKNLQHPQYDSRLLLICVVCLMYALFTTGRLQNLIVGILCGLAMLKLLLFMTTITMKIPPPRVLGFAYGSLAAGIVFLTSRNTGIYNLNPRPFLLLCSVFCFLLVVYFARNELLRIYASSKERLHQNELLKQTSYIFSGDMYISWANGFPYQWIQPWDDLSVYQSKIVSSTNLYPNALSIWKSAGVNDPCLTIMNGDTPVFIRRYSDLYAKDRIELLKRYFREKYLTETEHQILSSTEYYLLVKFKPKS
ncbi:MAG: hypothetical protein NZM35_07105 [Chitinophagales bacterium]|nr:hypothetical protein [Chitinophagales bacterium]MDW8418992.1 hypothetical protein [Chitinophagales bacterium]